MTWRPTDAILNAALARAAAAAPREACGAIFAGEFLSLPNKASELDSFVMDMPAYLAAVKQHGPAEAIVHSHVYQPPIASAADRAMCESTGIPWLIVAWPTAKWAVITPSGFRAPLIGRKWAWGVHDCYGVIRDGFQELAGVTLPDFNRDWLFWSQGARTIEDNFAAAGFAPVDDAWRELDVIGMRVRSPVVNHLGLFLAPDVILHQMAGRLSVREVYGGVYAAMTTLHLRHESRR